MISESEKVLRRAGHYCFEYRQEVYIWGGFIQYLPKVKFKEMRPNHVYIEQNLI